MIKNSERTLAYLTKLASFTRKLDYGGTVSYDLLASYPRVRPPLTSAHEKIYVEEYKANRTGQTVVQKLAQRLEAWMHKQVSSHGKDGAVLEIGAGTLNHLPYETAEPYDVVEPFTELYANNSLKSRIRCFYGDITEVPHISHYDRVISIAVLEHLEDLPVFLALSGLMLKPNGLFQAGIPSEGGLLWSLAWNCTTGLAYRIRTGLDYGTLMRHEHVNTASEIIALVCLFFEQVEIRRFPLPLHHLSLYVYVHATEPRIEFCWDYMRRRQISSV